MKNRLVLSFVAALMMSVAISQISLAAHAVRHHGTGSLKQTWGVDFDSGTFNTTDASTEDMDFDAVSSNHRYLEPVGNAGLTKVGAAKPSYATCAAKSLKTTSINVKSFPVGTWFCLRTGPGHLVRFRVNSVHSDPGPVSLTYTTWK